MPSSSWDIDDIEAVFSTGDNLSAAQTALETEVLERWSAFARTGNPNPTNAKYTQWPAVQAASATDVNINMLIFEGSSSKVVQLNRQAHCGPNGFWGRTALFDAQVE